MHDLYAPLRFSVDRGKLEVLVPDPAVLMGDEDLYDFTYWLASRVQRRTFPDAFDRRLGNDVHKQIRKSLSGAVSAHIEALLYSISTYEELAEDSSYRLRLVLLARPKSVQSPALLGLLRETQERIQNSLADRNGIIVESVALEASNRMSVAQYQGFYSWGFEDLSLEADDEPPRM